MKRVRGAVGMGLTWAVGWAVTGVMIGVASAILPEHALDFFLRVFDAPLPALAIPGFFCGAMFSIVLGLAGRHRRFEDLSLPRFTAWGAGGGLLFGLIPVAAASLTAPVIVVGLGTLTFLSAASAAATLTLARRAENALSDAGARRERIKNS